MKKGTREALIFSRQQLFVAADGSEKLTKGSTITRFFYDGKEFTERKLIKWEDVEIDNKWHDAEIVFVGIVDSKKITKKEVDHHQLYLELSSELDREFQKMYFSEVQKIIEAGIINCDVDSFISDD